MANKKISDLTALTSAASNDYLPILDTDAVVTKKITVANLLGTTWLTWTPTFYGWSGTPTGQFYYASIGKIVILNINMATGTSNQAYASISLPVTATNATNHWGVCGYAVDASSVLTAPSVWNINYDATSVIAFGKAYGALQGWTTSGTKRFICQAIYQAA